MGQFFYLILSGLFNYYYFILLLCYLCTLVVSFGKRFLYCISVLGPSNFSLFIYSVLSFVCCVYWTFSFLPRCMECRRGLTMRFLSVCLSVCLSVRLSNACIVTKRKKNLSGFLHHAKDHSVYFYEKKNGWWGATPST